MLKNISVNFLDDNSNRLISLLEEEGFAAYAVGGCVRDFLLGRECGDIDIATAAVPAQVEAVLDKHGIKYAETGLQHGTVSAIVNHTQYEITTFRSDGAYSDNRRPQSVHFEANIEGDLSRRDFTVNAMAYNPHGELVDMFGGRADLENRIIRCVGDADKRFREDSLRILRALRFASVLGFEIEENTKRAALENRELLLNIAGERVFAELLKLLAGQGAVRVLSEFREIFAVVIPELEPCFDCAQNNPWHIYDVWGHIIHSVGFAPENGILRLTMLLHDIGKPLVKTTDSAGTDHFKTHADKSAVLAENILNRFHASNEIKNKVVTLVKYHQAFENVDDIRPKRWLAKIGEEYTLSLFEVRLADLKAHNTAKTGYEEAGLRELQMQTLNIIKEKQPFRTADLKINGNDLLRLGYKGREIGQKLKEILSLVVDDRLKNEKNAIIDWLEKEP